MKTSVAVGSGLLAMAISGVALAGFNGITADLIAVNAVVGDDDVEDPATWTCRVYAELDQGDQLLGMSGSGADPMYWAAESQFYNHYAGGPTSLSIDPDIFPNHVDLPYDSWFTIGADSMYDNVLEIDNVSFSGFNTGGALYVIDGGFSVSQESGQGAEQNGRVLVAQLTVLGDFDISILGSINVNGVDAMGDAWSVDGYEFEINFIPAPASLALLAVGGLAFRSRRRG